MVALFPAKMFQFLDIHATGIQAAASCATLLVTAILVVVTIYYARTAANTLNLNRQQFDREWEPRIHAQTTKIGPATIVEKVTNLGRAAIVLTGIEMKIGETTKLVEIDEVLKAGEGSEFNWASEIIRAFNLHGRGSGQFSFDGNVTIRIRFESLGAIFYSVPRSKKVTVANGAFAKFSDQGS